MNKLLAKHPRSMDSLLDILRELQAADPQRHLSDDALREVAKYLGIPLSTVVSTASFYSLYSLRPRGRHIVRVCESAPCHLAGAETLLEALAAHLKVKPGETTADGAFTLVTTSCLGACAEAPAVMIDEQVHGNLTKEKAFSLIAETRRRDGTKS